MWLSVVITSYLFMDFRIAKLWVTVILFRVLLDPLFWCKEVTPSTAQDNTDGVYGFHNKGRHMSHLGD